MTDYLKNKYQKRNTYNVKLAQIEMSSLYHQYISKDDVLSHQSPYRIATINVVRGSEVASYQTKKWIKKIQSILFTNRTISSHIYIYYLVIKPENSFLNMSSKPTFTTISGRNPVKQNELAYLDIKKKIKKFNKRKNNNKWFVVMQGQEHSQDKGLTDNNHDNYIILTTKPVSKIALSQAFDREYSKFNGISENDVNTTVKRISAEDVHKVAHYVKENESSLPYCKHSAKGYSQIKKLQQLPDTQDEPIRNQYLNGILNTVKPDKSKKAIQQAHKCQPRALNTYLNKAQQIHNKQAKKPDHKPQKPNQPSNYQDLNIIKNNPDTENLALLATIRITLKNQFRAKVDQRDISHNKYLIKVLEMKLGLNQTVPNSYTISNYKQMNRRIKDLIPNKADEAKFFGKLKAYQLLKAVDEQRELEIYQMNQRIKQLTPMKHYENNFEDVQWAFFEIKEIYYRFTHHQNRQLIKITKSNIIIRIQPIKKAVPPRLIYHTGTGIPPP